MSWGERTHDLETVGEPWRRWTFGSGIFTIYKQAGDVPRPWSLAT